MDGVCGGSLENERKRGGGYVVLCMGVCLVFYVPKEFYTRFFRMLWATWVLTGSGVAPPLYFVFSFLLFALHLPLCELSSQYGPYTRYLLNYG